MKMLAIGVLVLCIGGAPANTGAYDETENAEIIEIEYSQKDSDAVGIDRPIDLSNIAVPDHGLSLEF